MTMRRTLLLLLVPVYFFLASCGSNSSAGGGSGSPPTITSVSVTCSPASIQAGQTSQCSATVQGTGDFNSGVNWSVGGQGTGTISASGLYNAPASVSSSIQVTVTATSTEEAAKSGSATVTIQNQTNAGLSLIVVGNTQSPSYPVTNGSSYVAGGDNENGIFSILTRGSGSTSLPFSTYLGGGQAPAGGTQLRVVWVDPASKDIFIGGRTTSPNFPVTAGVFQTTYAGGPDDAVLCRFTSAGARKWCTYLGTDGSNPEETVYAICGLDSSGNLAVAGRMNYIPNGTPFHGATATRIGPPESGWQAYAAKIQGDGSKLVWYTGFGGSGADGNRGRCVLDAQGDIYGEGDTESTDFPVTAGAFQTKNRGAPPRNQNAMVYEMAADGSHLIWASYLGGSGGGKTDVGDVAEGGLVLDANGDLYVAGSTPGSADFFVGGATGYQPTLPAGNGFGACVIVHIKADGSQILHSTFLGGAKGGVSAPPGNELDTECDAIALDSKGDVVVEGYTSYSDFPTTSGAYQTAKPGPGTNYNGFVSVLSPNLSTLIASTYIGGDEREFADNSSSIGFDADGNIFSMLSSYSTNFPTTSDALYRSYIPQGYDIVLFGLSPDLEVLVYGTYLGGTTASGLIGVSEGNWPWAFTVVP